MRMEALGDIACDLLNLETNTILCDGITALCDGITAEKLPATHEALTDIARRRHPDRFLRNRMSELEQVGVDVGAALPVLTSKDTRVEFDDWQVRAADLATFEVLRRAAISLHCGAAPPAGYLDGGRTKQSSSGIRGNAEQITAIYRGLGHTDIASEAASIDIGGSLGPPQVAAPAPLLSQGEVVLLRKIWEVGTETIAMQTVVLIDGDVFNRIQSGWETDTEQTLHSLHRQAVEASVAQWTSLFRIAAELIGSVFQGLFRDSPRDPDSLAALSRVSYDFVMPGHCCGV